VSEPIVTLSAVSKDYRGLRPLRIERLDIMAGERVAVVGPDQVAAEVLTNMITGATLPDSGEVRVFGRHTASIADADEWLAFADRIGIVSDRAVLLDSMTVLQNLAIPYSLEVEPPAPAIAEKAAGLASTVGLAESLWNRAAAEIPPAMRVLVRLARGLALGPGLLVLEHPTASVPRGDVSALADQIATTGKRGPAAFLVVTRDDEFARRVATRVLRHDPASGRLAPVRTGWLW
jgi:ABC-type transporter Mla maintaining outer membrane lipid asymmetry ATPase subunit MlaF